MILYKPPNTLSKYNQIMRYKNNITKFQIINNDNEKKMDNNNNNVERENVITDLLAIHKMFCFPWCKDT